MANNRFGEDSDRYAVPAGEKHPRGGLALNIVYLLIVLVIAFAASQIAGTVFGWIFKADSDEVVRNGDLSRNYYLVYPIRGIFVLIVFYACTFFASSRLGYSLAYEYKMSIPKKNHNTQAVFAIILFELLAVIFIDFWPSWYLSSWLAALFGFFDPHDLLESTSDVLGGKVDIEGIWTHYYLWLQLILEVIIAVGTFFILRKGRYTGEENAFVAREKLLKELQQ